MAMAKLNKLLCITFLSLTAHICYSSPSDSGIKKLAILSHNSEQTEIYANGRMQAEIDIIYELANGHQLKNIELKKIQTEEALSDWKITDIGNDFSHVISPSTRIYSKNVSDLSQTYAKKYLSTLKNQNTAICVILTTEQGSRKSTCEGGSANSSVRIQAIVPKYYTVNDFNINYNESPSFIKKEKVEYKWSHISLIPKNSLTLKRITTEDRTEPYASLFPMIVASQSPQYYYTGFPTGLNRYLDSVLYLLPINENNQKITPMINKIPKNPAQFPINEMEYDTNNRINLFATYGKNVRGENGRDGAFAKGVGEKPIEPTFLYIYDIYGNEGKIRILRSDIFKIKKLGYTPAL